MDFKSLPDIVEELRVTPSDKKRHENNNRSCPFQTCTLMQVGVWSLGLAVIKWIDFESKIFWLRKIGSDMRGEIGKTILQIQPLVRVWIQCTLSFRVSCKYFSIKI